MFFVVAMLFRFYIFLFIDALYVKHCIILITLVFNVIGGFLTHALFIRVVLLLLWYGYVLSWYIAFYYNDNTIERLIIMVVSQDVKVRYSNIT